MRLRMSGALLLLLCVTSWRGQGEFYLFIVRFVYCIINIRQVTLFPGYCTHDESVNEESALM